MSEESWRMKLARWLVHRECERAYRKYGGASITISRSITNESAKGRSDE